MGGYSVGFVGYLVRNWRNLEGPDGHLPKREWQLATRIQQSRTGGASYEWPATYRADLQAGLNQLEGETLDLLKARMAGAKTERLAARYDCSPSTIYRRLDDAVQRLTDMMNNGGEQVARTNGTNGKQTSRSEPSEREQELYDVFDLLEAKLATLPDVHWKRVTIARTPNGLDCRVTV